MYKLKFLTISIILVMALSLAGPSFDVSARPLAAPAHINLGAAEAFAVLAGAGITNAGFTTITGDVGSSPTPTETGFPGLVTINPPGVNHNAAAPNDATTVAAKTALTAAYGNAAGQLPQTAIAGGIIGSTTLAPGIYHSASSIQLNGPLTLDGGGNPNAVFVFQAGSTLVTASGSTVLLTHGTQACNVYWQVGSSATLGTTSTFVGTIMADQAITDNGGSIVNGRFLASVAAVTLNHTTISRPLCAPVLNSKSFGPASITVGGGPSTLTITLSNINTTDATLTSPFTDTLPAGVAIAAVPNAATTCGGAGAVTTGGSSVTLPTGRTIPGGGSCTLTVDVTAPAVGCFINTVPIGALVTSAGNNITSASATLCATSAALTPTTIATTLSSISVTVGSAVHDGAILSGAGIGAAGGSVTYFYYTDPACTLNAQDAGTKGVAGGVVTDSNSINFVLAGTYYWQAVYSGDPGFNPSTSPCNELLTVNKAAPTLTTTASGPVTVGGNITDTAHLVGGYGTLGGILTFDVFAPGDALCVTPIAVAGKTVSGAGDYTSANYATTAAGTYRWIAHYTGDANNNAVNTACNAAGETSTVTAAPAPAVLPTTGFAPQRVTVLSAQPAEKAYADLGDLWLEIPRLGVQMPIVGIPQTDGEWDVSWLGNQAGWLNGTAFPTWAGNSVLTGHVYDAYGNPGPFVHLNWLWWGDKVVVHAWGAQYVYEVRQVMQVTPGATSSVIKHEELPWVTLVTCRGYDQASNSYKYRVLVRAVLVEVK